MIRFTNDLLMYATEHPTRVIDKNHTYIYAGAGHRISYSKSLFRAMVVRDVVNEMHSLILMYLKNSQDLGMLAEHDVQMVQYYGDQLSLCTCVNDIRDLVAAFRGYLAT